MFLVAFLFDQTNGFNPVRVEGKLPRELSHHLEDKELTPPAVLKYETATSLNNPQQNNKSLNILDAKKNHLMETNNHDLLHLPQKKTTFTSYFPNFAWFKAPQLLILGSFYFWNRPHRSGDELTQSDEGPKSPNTAKPGSHQREMLGTLGRVP